MCKVVIGLIYNPEGAYYKSKTWAIISKQLKEVHLQGFNLLKNYCISESLSRGKYTTLAKGELVCDNGLDRVKRPTLRRRRPKSLAIAVMVIAGEGRTTPPPPT